MLNKAPLSSAIAAALAASLSTAHATDAPPPASPSYVPVTLTEDDMKGLSDYLSRMPYAEAEPLVRFFAGKEAQAHSKPAAAPPAPAKP